jgi:hypothetical protein
VRSPKSRTYLTVGFGYGFGEPWGNHGQNAWSPAGRRTISRCCAARPDRCTRASCGRGSSTSMSAFPAQAGAVFRPPGDDATVAARLARLRSEIDAARAARLRVRLRGDQSSRWHQCGPMRRAAQHRALAEIGPESSTAQNRGARRSRGLHFTDDGAGAQCSVPTDQQQFTGSGCSCRHSSVVEMYASARGLKATGHAVGPSR